MYFLIFMVLIKLFILVKYFILVIFTILLVIIIIIIIKDNIFTKLAIIILKQIESAFMEFKIIWMLIY